MIRKEFPITKETYESFFGSAKWNEILQAYYVLRNLADKHKDTVLAHFCILGFMACFNELERRFTAGKEEDNAEE